MSLRTQKLFAALSLLVFLGATAPAADAITRWEAKLKGVVCAMCVQSIKKRIEPLPEVQTVDILLQAGRIQVTAKPGKALNPDTLKLEIERAGFALSEADSPTSKP